MLTENVRSPDQQTQVLFARTAAAWSRGRDGARVTQGRVAVAPALPLTAGVTVRTPSSLAA